MKHILTVMLTIAISLTFCINIYATEASENGDEIMETAISQIIASQLSDNDKEMLKNLDNNLANEPVLKVYNEIYWSLAGKSSEEMISGAEKYSKTSIYSDYYVFSDEPYRIRVNNDQFMTEDTIETPQYVKDIVALSNQVPINGEQSDVTGIYCFDGDTSYNGIIVYILTRAGALIKFYENLYSDAMVFTESEFRAYADDYYNYITSYENNYGKNGDPIGGGVLSFKEFIDGRTYDNVDKDINPTTDVNNPSETEDTNTVLSFLKSNHQYLWLGFGLILVIGLIITGYSIYKKKKAEDS